MRRRIRALWLTAIFLIIVAVSEINIIGIAIFMITNGGEGICSG